MAVANACWLCAPSLPDVYLKFVVVVLVIAVIVVPASVVPPDSAEPFNDNLCSLEPEPVFNSFFGTTGSTLDPFLCY